MVKLPSVSTHSHPKVAAPPDPEQLYRQLVSTHSHPKVAASWPVRALIIWVCFNTQPPEGGCKSCLPVITMCRSFNTQPPEGGCDMDKGLCVDFAVSTHSHPKVAAPLPQMRLCLSNLFQHTATRRWLRRCTPASLAAVLFQHTATRRWLLLRAGNIAAVACFNTQPPEGGCAPPSQPADPLVVSTHSHPKVAAPKHDDGKQPKGVSTHSHPKVAAILGTAASAVAAFQHTATRRWLRRRSRRTSLMLPGFNTQPPEGGCLPTRGNRSESRCFNTQPPEGGCFFYFLCALKNTWFQHTATRRWLPARECGQRS